ncbi:hypothetical protein BDV95DRAFT_604307 [Massariosphaeria phaeospora]|uniref:Uncharacterized protein n=1 Tax=Massariosphaeria phaeospora TaxID=100035 RepID=A0A7C8MIF4_9PLEO|nr:hypothetical protein BDV95DRAFT_604307 [Massariosphaeria phaeospora]
MSLPPSANTGLPVMPSGQQPMPGNQNQRVQQPYTASYLTPHYPPPYPPSYSDSPYQPQHQGHVAYAPNVYQLPYQQHQNTYQPLPQNVYLSMQDWDRYAPPLQGPPNTSHPAQYSPYYPLMQQLPQQSNTAHATQYAPYQQPAQPPSNFNTPTAAPAVPTSPQLDPATSLLTTSLFVTDQGLSRRALAEKQHATISQYLAKGTSENVFPAASAEEFLSVQGLYNELKARIEARRQFEQRSHLSSFSFGAQAATGNLAHSLKDEKN